ncbi:MAG: VWA domain-containing protein [Bacilli bacterium]|nr:VWA domain-containing protein [Bacilli bacterium]
MGKYAGEDDLIVNTSARVPVVLCLDVSGSMYDCIGELNDGVEAFYEAVRKDDVASSSCEIAIVTFGSSVTVAEDFELVEHKSKPHFSANGGTDMTGGVKKALELLNARKQDYKDKGVDYYQPWLIIMSDGEPNDLDSVKEQQAITLQMEADKKLTIFAIFIGKDRGQEVLAGFSKRGAMNLKGHNFGEFFEWLGRSVSIVSQSQQGEKVTLDKDVSGWLDIDV